VWFYLAFSNQHNAFPEANAASGSPANVCEGLTNAKRTRASDQSAAASRTAAKQIAYPSLPRTHRRPSPHSASVVQSWRDPPGHAVATQAVLIAPAAVSSSQQTSPFVQLLLPEHASESPAHVPMVLQARPAAVAQQTCVVESHTPPAPHAI